MPILDQMLIAQFGRVVDAGNASIFVGAGLSQDAGYYGWDRLLKEPRAAAGIPREVKDLPLVAQYYEQETPGGPDALKAHILKEMAAVPPVPTEGHEHLAAIPVGDIWTTNYDCLIEKAIGDVTVVTNDQELRDLGNPGSRRVIKIHGSITQDNPPDWRTPPIITRHHYETYEREHPGLSALLRATYLTKSLLFLGFSFTDPNIDVLLRLSRTGQQAPQHYTVLRRPPDNRTNELRLHNFRCADLEASGVSVCEISTYAELVPILRNLARRTRRRWLFVSGSDSAAKYDARVAQAIGGRLADNDLVLVSLAGPAAIDVSLTYGNALKAQGRYAAERILLYFRWKDEEPPPPLPERLGTAIYTELEQEPLREQALSQCRAMLVLGGGDTTLAEVALARRLGIPVIPAAATGGAARTTWEAGRDAAVDDPTQVTDADWKALASPNRDVAAAAVERVVQSTMYLNDPGTPP